MCVLLVKLFKLPLTGKHTLAILSNKGASDDVDECYALIKTQSHFQGIPLVLLSKASLPLRLKSPPMKWDNPLRPPYVISSFGVYM